MFTKDTKPDRVHIKDLIHAAERRNGCRLSEEDLALLIDAVEIFLTQAIDKFVEGAKQHNADHSNPFTCIDHQSEAGKEIVDLWFYHIGSLKQRK